MSTSPSTPKATNMLCQLCEQIFSAVTELFIEYTHHSNGKLLLQAASASNACYICKLLWDRITTVPPDLDETGSLATGYGSSDFSADIYSIAGFGVAELGDEAMAEKIGSLYYNIFPVDEAVGSSWVSFSHLNNVVLRFRVDPKISGTSELTTSVGLESSTESETTQKRIQSWLSECTTSHKECQEISHQHDDDPDWLPTRLVDVGTLEDPEVRLHISSNHQTKGRYLTLSHCWGGQPSLQLSTSNLASMINGIEQKDIPKTFLDAMQITRQLGIRWLWIDSLCIIQSGDDGIDKGTELVTMEKVYNRSFCNIAATWSPNSKGGCFSSRDPQYVLPYSVDIKWSWASGAHKIYDFDMWQIDVLKSPLNSRAWVVQERLLAPRNLYFGSQQVSWECHYKDACEVFPEHLPKKMIWPRRFKTLDSDIDGSIEASWAGLVELYSSCNLTFGGDKLTAFAGIAKHLSHKLKGDHKPNGDYLAGLWANNLPWQLLWRTTFASRLKHPRVDLAEYRAPSWSWASVDGEVAYHRNTLSADATLIDIVDYKIEKVDIRNSTGAVKSASLLLRGFVSEPVKFRQKPGITQYALILNGEMISYSYALLDAPYIVKDSTTMDFLALPILAYNHKISKSPSSIDCLILSKIEKQNVYMRRGMFSCEVPESGKVEEFFLGNKEKPKDKSEITVI